MESIIVARQFKQVLDHAAVTAGHADNSWCLNLHRVQLRWSYLSRSGTRMVCHFQAPDAEAVRNALRASPPRPDYVHAVSLHAPAGTDTAAPLGGTSGELVVVERLFDAPVNFEEMQALEDKNRWCLDTYQVRFLRSYFARDRQRMVCLYQAPDAEAVRNAQRGTGLPYEQLWSASVFTPPPSAAESGHARP